MADYPFLPLWTDAYLADTRHLTTVEHGAYLLLLMEAWRRRACSIPDDDALLARLAGVSADEWAEIKPVILTFWDYDGRSKTWTQKRLKEERKKNDDVKAIRRDAALRRWKGDEKGHANAMQKHANHTHNHNKKNRVKESITFIEEVAAMMRMGK